MSMTKHIEEHISLAAFGSLGTVGRGKIVVSSSSGTRMYACTADGVADDRSTILAAMQYAIDNMPSSVEFGAGDYGISGGMQLYPQYGSRGLSVKGAGKFLTRIVFNGSASLTGNQYIAFYIHAGDAGASYTPATGNVAEYLHDVSFSDIGFYDNDPYLHQVWTATKTGTDDTSSSALTMTDSTATFTVNAYAGNVTQIRNITDGSSGIILSNTATVVTLTTEGLFGGTTNRFNAGDQYAISLHSTVEESHAISLNYVHNGVIHHCHSDSIGDESFNFTHVIQGGIVNNTTVNTPSMGNGSALNLTYGCSDILVTGNVCMGSDIPGTRSVVYGAAGFGLEIISGNVADMRNITITNNIFADFNDSGILPNNAVAATVMDSITIQSNQIKNCDIGIEMIGNNPHSKFNITNNTISDCGDGIKFNVTLANNTDCSVSFNKIHTMTRQGILCNGTRLNLSGNDISYTTLGAIQISSGLNIVIQGGLIDSCSSTTTPLIEATAIGKNVLVDGVMIVNALSTSYVINRCETVQNCRIEQAAPYYNGIANAYTIRNNTINCGAQIEPNRVGAVVVGNRIHTGGADIATHCLTFGDVNHNAVICNNYINTVNGAALRRGINIGTGSDYHTVVGNVIVTNTPGSGLYDNGTGSSKANNQDV